MEDASEATVVSVLAGITAGGVVSAEDGGMDILLDDGYGGRGSYTRDAEILVTLRFSGALEMHLFCLSLAVTRSRLSATL